jgi:GntR family transcriptional regulator, negative regulator for fad regulon and positive regulator of fabA
MENAMSQNSPETVKKPAEQAEQQLIQWILTGEFPPNTNLPAERQLTVRLGITRPTLREVLQRMERDGWLEIHHGKPTRVRDLFTEGSLSLLRQAVQGDGRESLTRGYLEMRALIAPSYTIQAIEKDPFAVHLLVQSLAEIPEDPSGNALADWRMHYGLAVLSGNPLFALILNDLQGFSEQIITSVFEKTEIGQKCRTAYRMIGKAARAEEPEAAEAMMRRITQDTLQAAA